MNSILKTLSLVAILIILSACGKSTSADDVSAYKKDFANSVKKYCKSMKMRMSIKSFESAVLKKNGAVVVYRMSAEGTSMAPKWTFHMKQVNDQWTVEKVDR